jgi:tRNA-specific 2-thiouridylase
VRCNDWLKFGKLAKYAEAVGADYVASGHYARVENGQLLRGRDHRKDQSYVLFGITPQALQHTILPIGGMEKSEVRKIAEELKLPVFNKPDSQEICFVPNQDYAGLVKRRSPDTFKPGEFVTTDGEVVGHHEGHQHFTIGQRKGLGMALGHRIFVTDIDPATSRVTVGEKESLFKRSLIAHQINVLDQTLKDGHARPCSAKIRYNHDPQPATAMVTGDDELTVRFDDPQTAITPGQAVVVYDGDRVLAGGWIDSAQ